MACLNKVCFDLITGNTGSEAQMNNAYILCTKTQNPPNAKYRFNYQGAQYDLISKLGTTAQGLRKFECKSA